MTKNARIIAIVVILAVVGVGLYLVYVYFGTDLATRFFKYRDVPVVQTSKCSDDSMEFADSESDNQSDQMAFYVTTNSCFREKFGSKQLTFDVRFYDHNGNRTGGTNQRTASGNTSPIQFIVPLPDEAAYKIVIEVTISGRSGIYATYEFSLGADSRGGGGLPWWKEFGRYKTFVTLCTSGYVSDGCTPWIPNTNPAPGESSYERTCDGHQESICREGHNYWE